MIDFALLVNAHLPNVDAMLASSKAQYDNINSYMAKLQTSEGQGKFTEISTVDAFVISFDDFLAWAEDYANRVVEGHPNPDSEEAKQFKEKTTKSLKDMRFQAYGQKQVEHVELDYQDGGAQFMFGLAVFCVKNAEKREIYVLHSGCGRKWESAPGHPLDRPWWEAEADNVKGFVKHGALKQARHLLQAHVQKASWRNVRIQNTTMRDITVVVKKNSEPWYNNWCSDAAFHMTSGCSQFADWQRYRTCEVIIQAEGFEEVSFQATPGSTWKIADNGKQFNKETALWAVCCAF